MNDFDFILFDRLEKIKQLNNEYDLEHTSYISFSGGKDSTVLHYLIDLALPNNKIPRVYKDTGIEYKQVRNFVKNLAKTDNRIIYLEPNRNIRQSLEKNGYPFKSKQHSHNFMIYKNNVELCERYKQEVIDRDIVNKINNNTITKEDVSFISNIPRGAKTFIKYYFGIREMVGGGISTSLKIVPKALKYQFEPLYAQTHNYSDKCCLMFKKGVLRKYERSSGRFNAITGMRREEGGNRNNISCITSGVNGKHFNFLAPLDNDFIEEFISKYNVKLCELYYPPFNFKRTGCMCCPYSLDLQTQLDNLKEIDYATYKQAWYLWGKVFKEYEKINYRLEKHKPNLFDKENEL